MSVLDTDRQRRAFTDVVRPPPGYTLGACIGTTYSLDFEVFTSLLLAFAGADVEDPLKNAPAVLTTVARLRSCLRVYVNGGCLRTPNTSNRLFALYDRILWPKTMSAGAFHPKLWLLRFDPVLRPERARTRPIYRVLVSSRNVTDSGCWEIGALFEGSLKATTQRFGSDVSEFVRNVAVTTDLPSPLWRLIEEVKQVEFNLPRHGSKGLRLNWQVPGRKSLADCLPQEIQRALLISPFVRMDFIRLLSTRTKELILVSTQDELDRLPETAFAILKSARLFVVTSDTNDDAPTLDLHAKLLAWETDADSETMIGSANATGRGWGCGSISNCEAMVALRPGLGIDQILNAFVFTLDAQVRPWIEEYNRQSGGVDAEDEVNKMLDRFRGVLQADRIRGEYDANANTLRLTATRSSEAVAWPAGMCAEIVPLLQREQAGRLDYRLLYGPGAVFTGIRLEDVAAFAYIVVFSESHEGTEATFVSQFELSLGDQSLENRDRAVHADILRGVDAESLLEATLSGLPGAALPITTGQQAGGGQHRPSRKRVTIERILEACTADPIKVQEIDAVLDACDETTGMHNLRKFWVAFRDSLKSEYKKADNATGRVSARRG